VSVAVLGGGAFGTALAHVVAEARGEEVVLWSDDREVATEIGAKRTLARRLPGLVIHAKVRPTTELAQAARARLLVLAVPSTRVVETIRALGEHVTGDHVVLSALGVPVDVGGQLARVSEVVRAETAVRRIGVLAGPALPRDLAAGRQSALVVASHFDEVTSEARRLFDIPARLRVYGSRDLSGVELSSSLSSAMTVALGLTDGIGMVGGPRAVIVCRAVAEGTRLVTAAGGAEKTFSGLAGLGNLLVRASSEFSDDYHLGLQIARGETLTRKATAGSRAAVALVRVAQQLNVRLPLTRAVAAVVHEGKSLAEAASSLQESTAAAE
jgi:glycerol-3-phosphate dehydrogenase (NAD(P)+)